MSINIKQSVKCPKCGQMSDITVWTSLTVKDSPDLKQDLLRGKVNIFRCPSCAETALMPQPLLYNDEEKKLIILFDPAAESDDTSSQNGGKHISYKRAKEKLSKFGESAKLEGYNLRFSTDFNEFLEKILIFDNGLNDKAIEVIKLIILSQDEENSKNRTCRFGKREGSEMEFVIADRVENRIYTSHVPFSSYDTVWKQLRISGVKPYSFTWEKVDSEYAVKLLNGMHN